MINKDEKKYWVIGAIILVSIIVWVTVFVNWRDSEKQNEIVDNANIIDKRLQIEKNVTGIVQHTFSNDNLEYTTQVANREVESTQKECIVVELDSVDTWNHLGEERQIEIMEGLINTSRLQIDKAVGCVVIEKSNVVVVEGFWRDTGGYVIIKK